jgi:hypothetical protein
MSAAPQWTLYGETRHATSTKPRPKLSPTVGRQEAPRKLIKEAVGGF